ncbi:Crp/Fnr family transcriptional regulator [Elizabethkingia meningoseptica]|uniref:Crp/Fnr family transcriptional regulator n=1 Tax=Elizabethkingia meningoseptica TaxID=238 RepID=UPI0009993E3A|nr:Crp/Fnr family transcriptional regulator [Elizabethkingia meningoseptica]EJK5328910.1 Crp/Fnr family transcriptional regulator [Elizabethkingia meningoseptica]MCL1676130.1 Crp/Fnr family transcriptional regulator [Elizabethkingia meningoseptica]MCL1684839.1 Crp/Fnr family transcriptional regulator [Elizabethkingia meningoseptica]MDE5467573.1 Crp/Fnr family transcriptional regulator [Elizabethkingia meningoseptica]MDE5474492.1 Crp/Fnr family transcriptional regulator [Elizabethkingia meningo
MIKKLNTTLDKFQIISAFSKQLFADRSEIIELSKNQDIFLEGKKNQSEYLLLSGAVHRYNISEKGDMVTTGFYMSESVITPHFARTSKGKSIFSLQTLTDAVIAEIPVKELDNMRLTNKEFNAFGLRIVEKELAGNFYNEVVFRSYNAKERLLTLRKQFPGIENLVPHHIIASYLGITKVSFSRLRNELLKK